MPRRRARLRCRAPRREAEQRAVPLGALPRTRRPPQRRGNELGDEQMVLGDFGLAKDLAAASGFTQAAGTPGLHGARAGAPHRHHRPARRHVRRRRGALRDAHRQAADRRVDAVGRAARPATAAACNRSAPCGPTIPPTLAAVIGRGLAFDPDQRYASAPDLAAALLDAPGRAAAPLRRPWPGRSRLPPAHAGRCRPRATTWWHAGPPRNVADGTALDAIEQRLLGPPASPRGGPARGHADGPAWSSPRRAPRWCTLRRRRHDRHGRRGGRHRCSTVTPAPRRRGAGAPGPPAGGAGRGGGAGRPIPRPARPTPPCAPSPSTWSGDDGDGAARAGRAGAALVDRAPLVQASAALAALAAAWSPPPRPSAARPCTTWPTPSTGFAWSCPDAAARSTRCATTLPAARRCAVPLRRELRRLLRVDGAGPAARPAPTTASADLRAATQDGARAVAHAAATPAACRSRRATSAELVERSLERLWVELEPRG